MAVFHAVSYVPTSMYCWMSPLGNGDDSNMTASSVAGQVLCSPCPPSCCPHSALLSSSEAYYQEDLLWYAGTGALSRKHAAASLDPQTSPFLWQKSCGCREDARILFYGINVHAMDSVLFAALVPSLQPCQILTPLCREEENVKIKPLTSKFCHHIELKWSPRGGTQQRDPKPDFIAKNRSCDWLPRWEFVYTS